MSTTIRHVNTQLLDIAYEDTGPAGGAPVLLLHGWPDDVRTYDGIAPSLHEASSPTRFVRAI